MANSAILRLSRSVQTLDAAVSVVGMSPDSGTRTGSVHVTTLRVSQRHQPTGLLAQLHALRRLCTLVGIQPGGRRAPSVADGHDAAPGRAHDCAGCCPTPSPPPSKCTPVPPSERWGASANGPVLMRGNFCCDRTGRTSRKLRARPAPLRPPAYATGNTLSVVLHLASRLADHPNRVDSSLDGLAYVLRRGTGG